MDVVWYLAYGSNLSGARLARYLERAPGDGAPLDVVATTLDHRLLFAHESRVWTGGTAFLDPAPGSGSTLVRAWLLTVPQLATVVAMENGRPPDAVLLPDDAVPALGPGASLQVDDRRYGLLLGCPSPDGVPALTFTTPEQPLPSPTTPSCAYVDVIVAGLVEGHGLDEAAARAYLAERGGTAA